jgi:undecaprenyl-diphosphatase
MNVADIIQAIILGIVQGIGEFLPISSSGHLIIVSWLMSGKTLPLTLNIALHVGTLLAVLVYFWRDWLNILKATISRVTAGSMSYETSVLLPGIILGSIPAGIIGVLWNDKIEQIFHNPLSVCAPLFFVGIALWQIDKRWPTTKTAKDLSIKDCVIIGIGQACALIPGVSRSGATILTGRLRGIDRESAARFSFMLGTPAMGGAALLKYKELLASAGDPVFYIGTGVSFLTGVLAISFLMKFLKKFGFGVFAAYRALLAVFILIVIGMA